MRENGGMADHKRRQERKTPSTKSFLSRAPELIGSSPQMVKIRDFIEKLRESSISVLLVGESGTGKSFAARLLGGSQDPFIFFSCGSLSDEIATWQLLGIPKGVPSGPSEGILSKADGGILFLDEVEMLSPKTQMILLAALQEGSFQAPGNSRRHSLNVRFVSATGLDLKKLVEKGTHRMRRRVHTQSCFHTVTNS
jgi:DNA-binding NtrC family response regulator